MNNDLQVLVDDDYLCKEICKVKSKTITKAMNNKVNDACRKVIYYRTINKKYFKSKLAKECITIIREEMTNRIKFDNFDMILYGTIDNYDDRVRKCNCNCEFDYEGENLNNDESIGREPLSKCM